MRPDTRPFVILVLLTMINGGVCCLNDCQLNGECVRSKSNTYACTCDVGWAGSDCGLLDLNPTPTIAYGYGTTPNTSSWGGGPPAYDNVTGLYHLFVSELAGDCK